jgi:hypothetical protein
VKQYQFYSPQLKSQIAKQGAFKSRAMANYQQIISKLESEKIK